MKYFCMSWVRIAALGGCETAPLHRGYRWYCRGAHSQSVETLTYYLEHSSDCDGNKEARAAGFFYRGLSKTELGLNRDAINDYREALLRVPDFFYASFNLGVEYVRLHEYGLALSMLCASWVSVLKARRGELDESLLWNRKVFLRDQAYCFYYYGMMAIMCGEADELETLLRAVDALEFKVKKIATAREVFRRIASGELSVEEGRNQVKSWLKEIDEGKGCSMG